jgi:hypothetical protein
MENYKQREYVYSASVVMKLRACLFGLSVAGCPEKAAVQRKLLSRISCCSEFHCLAS